MMNVFRWFAVLLLASAWLFAVPVFGPRSAVWSTALLAAGFVMMQRGATDHRLHTLLVAAAVVAVQGLLVLAWYRVGCHFHAVPGLASIFAVGLELVGLGCHVDGATIHIGTGAHLVPVSVTWEKLGLLPASLFLGGALVALFGDDGANPRRRAAAAVAATGAWLALRFLVLTVLVSRHQDPAGLHGPGGLLPYAVHLFSDPTVQLLSFLPLPLALGWLTRERASRLANPVFRVAPGRLLLAGAASCAAFTIFGCCASSHALGPPRTGRVLIDSSKTPNWERTDRPFDTEWFGRASVYNFVTATDYLSRYFDVSVNEDQTLERELLGEFDVLIVKTPTRPFSPTEIDDIVAWVARGGGLCLLGDHTDLLGMTTHLNALSRRFGIGFRRDGCNRLHDGGFVHHFAPRPFRHPIVGRVEEFSFLTSCTLEVPFGAEHVMIGSDTFSDPADYSRGSFFGNMIPDTDDEFGLHVLGAVVRHGEGRVLAFSDSTVFSTFCVMAEDRPDFVVDAIAYLDRGPATASGSLLWPGLGALLLVLLAARFAGAGRPFFAIVLPLAAATGTLTGAEISYRHTLATLPPAVRVDATDTIALVRDNGDYALPPALGHLRGPVDSAFDTFYVWSQRLRLFPREREFDTALDSAAVMFLRPQSPLGPEQTERLAKFVLDGGRLLVVDSILNPSAAASRILEPFGMTLETALVGDPNRALRSPRQLVRGGEPLLTDSDGQPLAAIARVGRGVVVAVAEGAGLSRAGLGTPMDDPDAAHRSRFEDVFALLRELFAAPRAK